ncbi:DUF6234 family protein [Streptomyces liangshanensis]|uniref:DUF6234 family protein n=1 Tax=Streptomyces liangshanensis TaxID=2717324 RepID=UPI0036DB8821
MTKHLPVPHRRRPWSSRTPRGIDLALAIPVFLLEAAFLVLDPIFGLGLEVWAAQGDQSWVDDATRAYVDRLWVLLVVVLVVALLAGLFRAHWTVIAHLLVALLAGLLLAGAHHQWDIDHAPPPGCVRYSANC